MYTLGISCYYHDSAASLLKDGKVLAAVEEERFPEKNLTMVFQRWRLIGVLRRLELVQKT